MKIERTTMLLRGLATSLKCGNHAVTRRFLDDLTAAHVLPLPPPVAARLLARALATVRAAPAPMPDRFEHDGRTFTRIDNPKEPYPGARRVLDALMKRR